ncbi:MAG: DUF4215 domain-containing protein [Myxococcales bacterium]|nr:DUF4215 domain-containing protein [Myxococcales bacterium]
MLSVVMAIPLASQAQEGDSDGDGVRDSRDLCPNTRPGRSVDEAGCDAFCEVVLDAANGSAFLRSRLLEVGTADWGSFGTVNAPPAGWHERPAGTPLGFVANPADDDWTNYQGDFFVPGTPEEGFGLNVGGVDYYTSRLMGERGVVGEFTGTAVECTPRICGLRGGGSVYWSGSRAGIDIAQTYSVFNEGLYILIQVTLTNTTDSEQTVYYMRNVDPDNMQTVTGDFVTRNTIVSQGDGTETSLALVSATTSSPDSYIALASSDPDARVTYGGFSNRDVDGVWNCAGGLVCALGSVSVDDIAISLAVRKVIPAGESRSFAYVYTLSQDVIAESVACTVPAVCGDGEVEGTEVCDDGGLDAGDGCDAACDVETGWECMGSPSVCTPVCGDGVVLGAEQCDDGNTENGDGCSDGCAFEAGWDCSGTPLVCTEICGDGLVVGDEPCDGGGESPTCNPDCTPAVCGDGIVNAMAGESCDDGNTEPGDGCSATCVNEECGNGIVDPGEQCDTRGESATCDPDCTNAVCGDGYVNMAAGEQCDDGNTDAGDACSPTCQLTPDAGPGDPDAGPSPDAGTGDASVVLDAGVGVDAGAEYSGSGGCGCSTPGTRDGAVPWWLMVTLGLAWMVRRRT